eukprot:TRINITY_DN5751_c0_g1_i1.p1 TRINITY_DN5751_c0_g1~~TRINITY_DN5751_c0_g1_i1.p1  ORF type:complete len:387 (+),score=87.14 TRINITY_DN5751_c0_g1_i1:61-1221(+)
MDVSVRHVPSGRSCVVGVSDDDTVLSLKEDALAALFAGSADAAQGAAGMAVRIEGREEDLDDAQRIADTGLEGGDGVQLVRRWVHVKAPATYHVGGDAAIQSLVLSRCGTLCSICCNGGTIAVFDTRTASPVTSLTHGTESALCSAFSVCGTWLATCSEDGLVCVWLTETWERVWTLDEHKSVTFRGHALYVWSAVWTHCGRLITGDNTGVVFVWDLEDTPNPTALTGHSKCVYGIVATDTRIFTGADDTQQPIRVWDINTLQHTATLEKGRGVQHIALTLDERHLVACSDDKTLKVFCTSSLTCLRTVELACFHDVVAVSGAGDIIATSCTPSAMLYRLSTGKCLGMLETEGVGVALSPCGKWLFTPHGGAASVRAVCDVGLTGQ